MQRRTYIDWLRGVAVLIMIEWHAIDAWTADSERSGQAFKALAFLGGWAAPLFLFLAGVAVPLAVESHMRRGMTAREASWTLQKRGWQILLLAHVFRLQSYFLNPSAVWHSVLKPDILNILGLGLVAAAYCWGRSTTVRGRMVWLLGPALLVLIIAPLSRGWWWPTLLHPRLEAYIRPNGGFGVFPLFPWTAFVFIGAALGVWIAMTRTADEDRRFHVRLAALAVATIAAGFIGMFVPSPFTHSSFWTTSWSFFFMRTGAMTLALAGAWMWLRRSTGERWSPVVLFGQTSLFIYWVHVEMAYGLFSAPIKKKLTVTEAVIAYVLFTGLLLWMAEWWRTRKGPWIPAHMRAPAGAGLVAVTALLTMGMAPQEQWRPVSLRLPPGIPVSTVAACVTDTGVPALRPSAEGEVLAQCGLAGVARCTIAGLEPLDVELGALCRGVSSIAQPHARAVVPTWPARDPVVIEWRAWGDAVTTLLAARQVDPASGDVFRVSAQTRLLRVHRPGASPLTLVVPPAADPPQDVTMAVPPRSAGGELFLHFDERERQMPTLILRGPEVRVVGVNGAPFVSVPGLPAGEYVLQFGSIEALEGRPIEVTIKEGHTTELVPRLPAAVGERRISGIVTFNGAPLARRALEILQVKTDDTWTTTTDDRGRYSVSVPADGVYVVRVVSPYDFGQLEAEGEVRAGETTIDLDLAGAIVSLTFLLDGTVPDDAVQFVLDGPRRVSGITRDFSQPTELFAVPFGTYVVRASMDPDFVTDAVTLVLDPTAGTRALTLDLRTQTATLRVTGEDGRPVSGVRARAGLTLLRAKPDGSFDVRRVSPGATVVVRAPGRVPACVMLTGGENVVTLRSLIAAQQFTYASPNLRVPPGRIRFGSADACAVPLEEFEWRRIPSGFEISNLPEGVGVIYEYGSQTMPIKAPGDPIVIK